MKNQVNEITGIIEKEILNEFNSEREKLRIQAREAIQKIQEQNWKSYNSKRKEAHKYEINDLVSIVKTQFSSGAKLKPKNVGPYKVTKVKKNERYNVEKLAVMRGLVGPVPQLIT